jgi:hypothetical protein
MAVVVAAGCVTEGEALTIVECRCPDSNLDGGTKPVFVALEGTSNALMACGHLDSTGRDGSVYTSEFTLYRCLDSTAVLGFGALEECRLERTLHGCVITRIEYLPFGPNGRWQDVDVFNIGLDTAGSELNADTTYTFAPPQLSRSSIRNIVRRSVRLTQRPPASTVDRGSRTDLETAIFQMLAVAMIDPQYEDELRSLPETMKLSGHYLELHQLSLSLYHNFRDHHPK